MAKDDSPEFTVWMPPSTDCPTIKATEITTSELDDTCARNVVEDIFNEKTGVTSWTFDFITTPVNLEIKRKNRKTQTYTWNPSGFPCLSEFLDDVRSGLVELFNSEFIEIQSDHVASIIQHVRNTCIWTEKRIIEIDRVPSEADMVIERIRLTLGLEGLKSPSRRVDNLARKDMRRLPKSDRHPTQIARWLKQVQALYEAVT